MKNLIRFNLQLPLFAVILCTSFSIHAEINESVNASFEKILFDCGCRAKKRGPTGPSPQSDKPSVTNSAMVTVEAN